MDAFLFAKVEASGLSAALVAARKFSKRTPAVAANTAAFFVMRGWVRGMRRVAVPTIDAELGTLVTPRIGKRGQPLSTRSSKNRILSGTRTVEVQRGGKTVAVPLSVLIIQASVRPGSNYNLRTGHRYARAHSPFFGKSKQAGRQAMRAAEHRMIAARRSSVAFIAASGIPAIRALETQIDAKYRRGAPPREPAAEISARHSRQDKGVAYPAAEGVEVVCRVELQIGMGSSMNSQNMNDALHRYGGPELQWQLDVEAMKVFAKVAEWEARALKEQLRRTGVIA